MDKKEIIEFFDRRAPDWDLNINIDVNKIESILDHASIDQGMNILDVACGTGVLFDFYRKRGVASVTAIDLSPKMAEIAKAKSKDYPEFEVICGDVEEISFGKKFDGIVVYNSLPHFPDIGGLIKVLSDFLRDNGLLTIAHAGSREKINEHHSGSASYVSQSLPTMENLAKMFEPYLKVEFAISDENIYQIVGRRTDRLG